MIGREYEIRQMHQLLQSYDGEMLAIIGRRRVGKTYLIRQTYSEFMSFEIIGVQNETNAMQLKNFYQKLKDYFGDKVPDKKPSDWLDAFNQLKICLEKSKNKKSKKKQVIFFDEVPWLADNSKRRFIEALGYFWNSWASQQKIVIVLCGSASSWIVKHIVNTKGGLYNRITKLLHLKPFTLYETKRMLESNGVNLDPYQIIQLYMAFGGIPHYINQIRHGLSAIEIVQKLCFNDHSIFKNEFDNLYDSIFSGTENHVKVVRALQKKWSGLTRQELLETLDVKDGGNLSKVLKELVQCDFVLETNSYLKKKNHITYRLIDEYSIFYLSFIEGQKRVSPTHWMNVTKSQAYKVWSGYAFENVCFRHQNQIVRAMQLQAIHTEFSTFKSKGNSESLGTQIDMLLDRADGIINLFEIKFYNEPIILTKSYAEELRRKVAIFRTHTKTRKTIFVSMISVFGNILNENSRGFLAHDIKGESLFIKAEIS